MNGAQGGRTTGGSVSVGGVPATGGYPGNGGASPLPCGLSDADTCAASNYANCGSIVDTCGVVHDCGTCEPGVTCGVITPNQCADFDCLTACPSNFNCGYMSDTCGGLLICGADPNGKCSGTDVCIANVCATNELVPLPIPPCIAGSQGCLCDSMGDCAPGLTCSAPNDGGVTYKLCCDSTGNCASPVGATNIAMTCAGTGTASCTPGVMIPAATATTDNCGYPTTSFKENAFACGINATGGGAVTAQIQAYFNDEWPLTLGCATAAYPVSPLPADPGAVYYPQTGDPACYDSAARPMRPTLYITDITQDPNCTAGDQQQGGPGYNPIAVFGTWTYATESGSAGTPVKPTGLTYNYWILGTGSDPIPASVNTQCPCTAQSCPGSGLTGKGYGAEVRFEAGLISGHTYRLQFIAHDGDQTQSADAGEACITFCAGNGVCAPMTCADYPACTCGPQDDNCGGSIDCGPCPCLPCIDCEPCTCLPCEPATCEDICPIQGNGKRACQTTEDDVNGYSLECLKFDGLCESFT